MKWGAWRYDGVMTKRDALVGVVVVGGLIASAAGQPIVHAQDGDAQRHERARQPEFREVLGIVALPDGPAGELAEHDVVRLWRPICGTPLGAVDEADLRVAALRHDQILQDQGFERISRQGIFAPRTGFDMVFNVNFSGAPSGAAGAFAAAEAYLESVLAASNVEVSLDVTFAPLSGLTLGLTSTIFLTNVSYTSARAGLVAGRDSDDWIQLYLPATTVPTRFNQSSGTISNVSQMDWPISVYNATIGDFANSSGSMQLSSTVAWDVDPSNGVTAGQYSLVDVIIHEVGHALGFITKGDASEDGKLFPMDLYRFASANRTGLGTTKPVTLQDFTSIAREVDLDSPTIAGNPSVASVVLPSVIDMSDGSPDQASHLRQVSSNPANSATGIMQPVLATGVSFRPDYFRPRDRIILDAMGWSITDTSMLDEQRQQYRDWNRDGWPDVLFDAVTATPPGLFASVHFGGYTYTGWASHPVAPSGWRRVKVQGDFNSDNIPDILWRNTTTSQLAVWHMNAGGTGVLSWYFLPPLPDANFQVQAAGDMNFDGADDLLLRNPATGFNAIWYLNNGYLTWSQLPSVTGEQWVIAGAAWLTDNSTSPEYVDLLWRNTVTGDNYIWGMDDGQFRSSTQIPPAPAGWVVKGLGDWNGDAYTDIFWWNTTTGATAFWFMVNETYQSWTPGPGFSPGAWE